MNSCVLGQVRRLLLQESSKGSTTSNIDGNFILQTMAVEDLIEDGIRLSNPFRNQNEPTSHYNTLNSKQSNIALIRNIYQGSSSYMKHAPIYIDDNADFATVASSGNGTLNNPYLIDGYNITNSTTTLMHIQDTSAYFQISNNLINGITSTHDAILLHNVMHGTIINNIIQNCHQGIHLQLSSVNNSVLGNTVLYSYEHGINIEEYSCGNTVSNNNISYTTVYQGIRLCSSANNNHILNNTITNSNSNGIEITCSYNNIVSDNNFSNNNHNGIWLDSSSNNIMLNNNICYNSEYGFLLEAQWESSSNNTLSNNTICNNNNDGIAISDSANNNVIQKNILYNNSNGVGISGYSSNNVLLNNSILQSRNTGISISEYSSNNVLLNNTILQSSRIGIDVIDSQNYIINNTVSDNGEWGINIHQDSNNNEIIGNTVTNNGFSGICIENSSNNIIKLNIISLNNHEGIAIKTSSNNNTIGYNTITTDELVIWGTSANIIENNTLTEASNLGLGTGSTDNHITWNTFTEASSLGLGTGSTDNHITWNDFINHEGVKDDGSNNIFEYNYFSDWTSPDINNDGIVDNPYLIDGFANNRDPYPLVSSFTNIITGHYLSTPTISYPNGGETIKGIITIKWSASIDSLGHTVTYSVYYSYNSGATWNVLAMGLTTTSFLWNTSSIAEGSNYLIKIVASCSEGLSIEDTSDSIFRIVSTSQTTNPTSETSPTQPPIIEQTDFDPILMLIGLLIAIGLLKKRKRSKI